MSEPPEKDHRLPTLALAALGVVYGDIGTSPLYAIRESLEKSHGVAPDPANVLGIVSLIFWSLVLIICLKYLLTVLRADHHGEGGILALTALVGAARPSSRGRFRILAILGLFGTALLYGDGMITPAISVLSAVEGLQFVAPTLSPLVLPITCAILVALFSLQSRGTAGVGRLFGPVVLIWFATLSALGLWQLSLNAEILKALSPHHGVAFFLHNGWNAFLVLGSVFLVVTGGEALYADMGHFGRRPIQLAWFTVAFPALMLNYLGQGALILRDPAAAENPFYLMAPPAALPWVVAIATAATVIASQALISGVFSLSMQSVQLGYLPRLPILHTSASERGQIYVPSMNWMLMICCLALVLGFGTSSRLAAAYGVAVTMTMVITTLLLYAWLRHSCAWPRWKAGSLCGFFLTLESAFLAANLVKIPHGGWFPLVIGALLFTLMRTWNSGRAMLFGKLQQASVSLESLEEILVQSPPQRAPGTAIFLYGNPRGTPPALLANLKHNGVLHQRVVLLTVDTLEKPYAEAQERLEIQQLPCGFERLVIRYGFMEKPDLPKTLEPLELGRVTFFLGRETLIPRRELRSGMPFWQENIFALMSRNATDASAYFGLPPDQVVELGTQLEI